MGTNADLYITKGESFFRNGKYHEAITQFNEAIAIDPKCDVAYNNRGFCYKYLGKFDLALSDYNKAIEINPKFVSAYSNRGSLYYYQGKYDKAIAEYNTIIGIIPNWDLPYNDLAYCYAYKPQPDYVIALNNLRKAESLGFDIDSSFLNALLKAIDKKGIKPTNVCSVCAEKIDCLVCPYCGYVFCNKCGLKAARSVFSDFKINCPKCDMGYITDIRELAEIRNLGYHGSITPRGND